MSVKTIEMAMLDILRGLFVLDRYEAASAPVGGAVRTRSVAKQVLFEMFVAELLPEFFVPGQPVGTKLRVGEKPLRAHLGTGVSFAEVSGVLAELAGRDRFEQRIPR